MQTVTLQLQDAAQAHTMLIEAQAASFLPVADAPVAGTVCQVVVRCGEKSLALFALAKTGGFRLTDDPADLRYQIKTFLESLESASAGKSRLTATEAHFGEAPPVIDGTADEQPVEPGEETEVEVGGQDIDSEELTALQAEVGSSDPLLAEMKRIQKLQVPQKIRLAEDGDLKQRTLLYRMYGKLVFDGLLRNPRITEVEVAKLAKLATIGVQQLQVITRRTEWLRSERIRNALLGNSRVPIAMAQRIIAMLSRYEIKPLLQRRDFPPQIQAAIKDAAWKLANK